jgi:hypothetical protein
MRGDFAGLHSPQQHGNGHARKRLAALAARENKLARPDGGKFFEDF